MMSSIILVLLAAIPSFSQSSEARSSAALEQPGPFQIDCSLTAYNEPDHGPLRVGVVKFSFTQKDLEPRLNSLVWTSTDSGWKVVSEYADSHELPYFLAGHRVSIVFPGENRIPSGEIGARLTINTGKDATSVRGGAGTTIRHGQNLKLSADVSSSVETPAGLDLECTFDFKK